MHRNLSLFYIYITEIEYIHRKYKENENKPTQNEQTKYHALTHTHTNAHRRTSSDLVALNVGVAVIPNRSRGDSEYVSSRKQ